MTTTEIIFERLRALGLPVNLTDPDLWPKYIKSESQPYMDLNFNFLYQDGNGIHISLTHYYEQNGDLVPDPDMEVVIDAHAGRAYAQTFQNSLVYGQRSLMNAGELDRFLAVWCNNLLQQKHDLHCKVSKAG